MRQRKGYRGYIVAILLIIIITIFALFITGNIKLNNKTKITEENYKCPEGYILKDEKCKKDVFECPSGSYLMSSGECMKSTVVYTCPSGYELYDETKCVNKEEIEYVYVCQEGYEIYQETKCKSGDKIIDAVKKINVENLSLKDAAGDFKSEIVEKEETTKIVNPTKKYEEINIDSISLSSAKTNYSMNYDLNNEYTNISIRLLPENVSTTVTCTSSNSEVVSLSNSNYSIQNSGRLSVSSTSPGVATITCTTSNGKSSSITLTICSDENFNGIKCK